MAIEKIEITGKPPVVSSDLKSPLNDMEKPGEKKEAKKEEGPDISKINEKMEEMQANLNIINDVDLQFSVHKASGRLMVTVTDGSTGHVIREIPFKEMLDIAARLEEMIGLLFDKRG